ncbi:hypothetical protein K440DRAFT_92189 [Wilcoxina mikolae CBS 423.85]|nr:hypothetical protein K440DRAFT_92189 [Wilcoxina mikolae CBS 423.85]
MDWENGHINTTDWVSCGATNIPDIVRFYNNSPSSQTFQLPTFGIPAQPMSIRRSTLRRTYHLPGEDLDYAVPSNEAWSKPSGPQFTCETCCLIMSTGARAHHLASESHTAAASKMKHRQERKTKAITDALRKRAKAEIRAKQSDWTCWICTRSMKWASRESHLAGSLHQNILHHNAFWTCDCCACTIPIGSKDTHLSGRYHARAFAEKNSKLRQLKDRELRRIEQELQTYYWTCDICSVSMACNLKKKHRSSPNHRKVARSQNETRYWGVTRVQEKARLLGGLKAIDGMFVQELWSCDVCDCTMDNTSRVGHLLSEKHAQVVRKSKERELKLAAQDLKRREKALQRQWYCDVCDRTLYTTARDSHLLGKKHIRAMKRYEKAKRREEEIEQWTCDVCDRTIPGSSRDSHLFGKRHARSVKKREEKKKQQEEQELERKQRALEQKNTCVPNAINRNQHLAGKPPAAVLEQSQTMDYSKRPGGLQWHCEVRWGWIYGTDSGVVWELNSATVDGV